ncbi:glycosyltransferase family 2 protein [Cyanobacteria bacterium FACHB-DQ100]|nr:glycosyltransferase family 2 protein [Cyanobacteria bacterium FACHB-DQ100]
MRKGLLHKPVVFFGPILDKILLTHFVVIGLPTALYYYILENGWDLSFLHVLIPILYLVTSIVVVGEALSTAITYRRGHIAKVPKFGIVQRFMRSPRTQPLYPLLGATVDVPKCSLIVAAYLPNEQQIILETLEYILKTIERPEAGLEVILAYNRPERLPIEDRLEHLAEQHPELQLLCVEGSRSKAQNINAALEIVTGEVTGILDADHHPNPDCFTRAWRWLSNYRYSAVQGRNVIRNRGFNFMTRMIAVEFECIYGVSHPAKSLLVDTGVFCGANGYWRTSVLKHIGFSSRMLTEDIDASFRTLLSGHNIVHDPTIIVTELAPVDVRAFWFQRKRWAQGWLEVTLKYQAVIVRSLRLDSWQKAYWTLLLVYSAGFHFIALQAFPMAFSLTLTGSQAPDIAPEYIWAMTLLTLASGPLQTLAAWLVRTDVIKHSAKDFWIYCLFIPFYCVFKSVIAITAIYDHIVGNTEWIVTRRSTDALPEAK